MAQENGSLLETFFIFLIGATLELSQNRSHKRTDRRACRIFRRRAGSPISEDAFAQGLEEREPKYLEQLVLNSCLVDLHYAADKHSSKVPLRKGNCIKCTLYPCQFGNSVFNRSTVRGHFTVLGRHTVF